VRRKAVILGAAWLVVTATACPRKPAWNLLQPPEVPNPAFPRGYQLLPDAAMTEWHSVGVFESETACEAVRKQHTDDSIDRARELYGAEAKYDLPVRRAVQARCVRTR
jgi:hypothetical protein